MHTSAQGGDMIYTYMLVPLCVCFCMHMCLYICVCVCMHAFMHLFVCIYVAFPCGKCSFLYNIRSLVNSNSL